jgi:pimeloyl-ACP methyl ester carboxylesterase
MVDAHDTDIAVYTLAADSAGEPTELIWAHGWGHTHAALMPLAESARRGGRCVLLDLPGFGASPEPPGHWGTADYADAIAEWLASRLRMRRIWIGHSFGGRVGLQLAARHPQAVDGLFLIATPGLPPHRSAWQQFQVTTRRLSVRLARAFTPEGPARERLRTRFGSSDYRTASPLMRQVLVKAVNEDLSEAARAVRVPTMLICGDRDSDAPPEMGERYKRLIPHAQLVVLRGFDHWSLLTDGRHQIVQRLGEFLEQVA